MVFYYCLIPVQCVLLVLTFLKMQQRTLDFNKCVFVIKSCNAATSLKHVKKRWKASFKTHECIEVQGRHFEQL